MPLGLGRSILSKTAAASAAPAGAFRQTNAIATDNLAGHTIENIDFDTDSDLSVVMWVRADGVTDFQDGTSGSTIFQMVKDGTSVSDGEVRIKFNPAARGWQHMVRDPEQGDATGFEVEGRGYGTAAEQATFTFDGSWQCVMMSCQSDHGTGTNGTSAGTSADNDHEALYVADTQFNINKSQGTGVTTLSTNFTTAHMGFYNSTPTTSMSDINNIGPGLHRGPMWIYNEFLDFHDQSVRRRFYNPANTDGFVQPTSTGTTAAGATQPHLFLYWDGTDLQNGGSDTVTLTKRTRGTGSFTNLTDGPGSGGTI